MQLLWFQLTNPNPPNELTKRNCAHAFFCLLPSTQRLKFKNSCRALPIQLIPRRCDKVGNCKRTRTRDDSEKKKWRWKNAMFFVLRLFDVHADKMHLQMVLHPEGPAADGANIRPPKATICFAHFAADGLHMPPQAIQSFEERVTLWTIKTLLPTWKKMAKLDRVLHKFGTHMRWTP